MKPLARRLIAAFGSFSDVISAPTSRLMEIKGVGHAVALELKIVEAAAHRLAQGNIKGRPLISSWDAVLTYCRTTMAHRDREQFRVLFLDRKNSLIVDETLGEGTVDQVSVYPREVVKRALELGASALILIHNHPSGDPSPSPEDITLTQTIKRAAEALDLTLHDHLIIGQNQEISLHAEGYI